MKPLILADTGPIVAFLDRNDAHHRWAEEQFQQWPLPFLTCEAVLTETAYVLYRAGLPPETVFDLIENGGLSVAFDMEAEAAALKGLLRRYRDIPMDLADACMVRMAERYPDSEVLTLDGDFHIYRKQGRKAILLITP